MESVLCSSDVDRNINIGLVQSAPPNLHQLLLTEGLDVHTTPEAIDEKINVILT